MKLREALEVIHAQPAAGAPFPVTLACGFTPLHLTTFLNAHIQLSRPQNRVQIHTGIYDDLAGTISTAAQSVQGVIVQMEWPDLDPRLGLRQLGGWSPTAIPDIVASARRKLDILQEALKSAAASGPVILSPPLLELPPMFHTAPPQLSADAARLEADLADFLARIAAAGIAVLNSDPLPNLPRLDIRAYLQSGFPYHVEFADAVARQLATLLLPPAPLKGVITDLDDTLWKGIVGEVGAANVTWDLVSHSQIHGVYQTLLQSLADAGVLVGVASKNSPGEVDEVLRRPDLLVSERSLFPLEVSWGPKSEAVARILRVWNIAADSVVFVDDSPMELAEVASAFTSIKTLAFPTGDTEACWRTIGELRELFGKPLLTAEDQIRAESVRGAAVLDGATASAGGQSDRFLEQSGALLTIDRLEPDDARAWELVNKTNQFNLNGRRVTQVEWREMLARPSAFGLMVSYQDKYGPLGKIAVLAGETSGDILRLHTWVMSCRAFSRRIEFQCLRYLFDEFAVREINLDFETTPKNGPLRVFLERVTDCPGTITLASLNHHCPPLFHSVIGNATHERS